MNLIFKAPLSKMDVQIGDPIDYRLGSYHLNTVLGKTISMRFLNEIFCIQCDRKTPRSFQGGFCFPCFKQLQDCGLCMIHPERCRHPEGKCDSEHWVHAACGLSHVVYLSNTAHVKVGVTRKTQLPTRWIDQGAIQAIPLFETNNRYLAGQIEVVCKSFFPDKTPWQAMLKNQVQYQDLKVIKEQFLSNNKDKLTKMIHELGASEIKLFPSDDTRMTYPVLKYPTTVKALDFHKTPEIKGTLLGIKGQYLLLDVGVLNVRKFGGYCVELSV